MNKKYSLNKYGTMQDGKSCKRSSFHTVKVCNREVRPQPVEIIIDTENKLRLFALESRGGGEV